MKLRLCLLLPLLVLTACDSAETAAVSLRVENASTVNFTSVTVQFLGDAVGFGPVSRGQKSGYREFETAYRYARVEVQVGAESYAITPIDYVGEEPLEAGRYTYVLRIEGASLELELERD